MASGIAPFAATPKIAAGIEAGTSRLSELSDLIEAADLSPGKGGLLRAVVRAAEEAVDPDDALRWFGTVDPRPYDDAARIHVAEYLADVAPAGAGLRWVEGQSPVLCLARARLLLDEDRPGEAAEAYKAAVAGDPSLKDDDIEEALAPRRASMGDNVVSLRGPRAVEAAEAPVSRTARESKTFADVGGLEDVKRDISRKIILPFKKPGLFDKFKRKAGGGVLLYGPPGCGKTMMARATAGEVGASFISTEISEVLDMYIGQSEKRLASVFDNARRSKPAVLFFDEIEALAARRRFGHADHGASLVSTFLNEMDGVNANNEGVLILAATNVPWAIDTAFRRPGRFDRVIFIPPPDREARLAILTMAFRDRPNEGINLEPIVNATSGFSGADLVGLVKSACDFAIEESLEGDKVVPVKQKHLNEAAKTMKPTTLEWLSQARNFAKYANEGGLYDDVTAFLDKHGK
jgi:transitional endoplasmic reticulum ATPase